MNEITIPKQLQKDNFRFIILRKTQKGPIEKKWESENNYKFNDPKILNHLKNAGNYGSVGGFGKLFQIDADSEEINEICKTLPETFTIKSCCPDKHKHHYYFIGDREIKPIRLSKEKVGDIGDIRSTGQYVVGPNCFAIEEKKGYEGYYKIIKDVEIATVTEDLIKKTFKDCENLVSKSENGNGEKKVYEIDTTKRLSQFTKNCKVPDYVLNNELPGNISKNWKLFPYVIDVLAARDVSPELYERLAAKQNHDVGAVEGWVKKAKEGKLAKTSCKKMREYLEHYTPELVEEICGDCPLYKKIKKEEEKKEQEEKLEEAFEIFSPEGQTEKFNEMQPIFYDRTGMFWLWNKETYQWEMTDEIDLLNMINRATGKDVISSRTRTEIINALKQKGRLNIPEPIKKSWVQFKNKIYDVITGEEFEASPKYFVTNPIPWEVGETEVTPTIDKYFKEWVGENDIKGLFEFIAYNTCPDKFMQRIFGFCGGGCNGKTTFIKLNYKFLGENNCVSTELKALSEDRFETAVLYKKLLAVMGEASQSDLRNTNQIKKIAGEDKLSFQFKGKTPITDDNTATGVCLTNSLPRTPDKSLGFYRKWRLIDFPNQFAEIKNDLIGEIPEVEFNNLAKKCLRILKELYQTRKFSNEGSFEDRMKRYEERSNPVMNFFDENFEEIAGENFSLRDFTGLCNEELKNKHLRIMTAVQVGKILREEGFSVGARKINDITSTVILNITYKKPLEPVEPVEFPLEIHRGASENLGGLGGSNGNDDLNIEYQKINGGETK